MMVLLVPGFIYISLPLSKKYECCEFVRRFILFVFSDFEFILH
jgi:hypothetical protein